MVEQLRSVCPYDPSDVVVGFSETSSVQVEAVAAKALIAQRKWAASGAQARSNALSAAAGALESASEEVTSLATREVGKPRAEMRGEVARGVAILRYYAQAALDPEGESLPSTIPGGLTLTRRRPHGVVGLVTPWNFPVAIPIWKAAPALAYGNAVVLKPAPAATATALRLKELFDSCLPADLFAVVPGDRITGEAVVANTMAVSFTGSTTVGQSVIRTGAARNIPVQAEMGGQNCSIVYPDANLATAASMVAAAAMGFAGQKCTATSRVIVVGDTGSFTDALVSAIESLVIGDPSEADTVMGPVISDAAARVVMDAREEATASGGRVLTGGLDPGAARAGYFVPPTLVDGLAGEHRLAQVETFGPFAVILSARDDDDAIRLANGVRYGLVASVFTSELDKALWIGDRIATGLFRVNAPTAGVDFHAPFGGIKDSSYGPREQGKAARDFYTWTQTQAIAPSK